MRSVIVTLVSVALLGLAIYFFVSRAGNPEALMGQEVRSTVGSPASSTEPINGTRQDKHPLLSAGQEELLESFGIDPESLPETVSPQMEECAVRILGRTRVDELKAGAAPTYGEILKARSCLQR